MKKILKETAIDPKTVTREDLIAICEAAIVPEQKWADRDSASAHAQLGELWAFLKAGCEYRIRDAQKDGDCRTDERTIWIDVFTEGFRAHEYAENPKERLEYRDSETYYMPQPGRISSQKGEDWY